MHAPLQAAEFLARRVRVAERQRSGEESPVTEKTRSVPPQERAFLGALVDAALGGGGGAEEGLPQLVDFAKQRVSESEGETPLQ